ncbi:MAG TPA: thiosulfate oxidation carrier protein SoxY [Bradyrhizobium sp.]|uniref:thiosulfate oxidation carrier protein SoxY n=1 Tax=Bradyrhizobium sp. TaxID=376 RepID=UPI002D0E2FA2|nr:thiosulfate oxidation carrier protein SoxY [Bradyrhizobium sp.]HLZ01113.1 thiosulfate oxidation carrier protein SoxY [Bradyrhizobium sp.]
MTADNGFRATRRLVLQGAGLVALAGLGNVALDVAPAQAAAADKYPGKAFTLKGDTDAIQALYGKTTEASDKIALDVPEIAENGAVVPISATTTLANVTSIAFLVSENPNALAAYYQIPESTLPNVSNRVKMAKTTKVTAIVESGGKLYSATKEVKVTVGGCGG